MTLAASFTDAESEVLGCSPSARARCSTCDFRWLVSSATPAAFAAVAAAAPLYPAAVEDPCTCRPSGTSRGSVLGGAFAAAAAAATCCRAAWSR